MRNKEAVQLKIQDKGNSLVRLLKVDISSLGFGRVLKPDELVAFIQQFASMYEAGIPIMQCLEALEKQTENIQFKRIIKEMIMDLESGRTFSDSIAKHPQVFSRFFVDMIRAGEKVGIIDKILERLSQYIEKMQELRRKVRGVFAYPIIVGVLALMVMIFLVIFIIPVFQDVYEGMNITLPLPTRIMISLSKFLRTFGWVLVFLSAGAGFLFYRYRNVKAVRRKIDNIKITMPVFGSINKKAAVSRFIRTLGNMLESGITVSEAIDTAKGVSGNVIITELIDKMSYNINRGSTIAESLEEQEFIPPTVVQMISAGEASGKLPMMLNKSAVALERDLDLTIKRLLILVEPVLTLVIACFVAFIAISIYLPMFDIVGVIHQR